MSLKARITLYSLTLAFGIFQTVISAVTTAFFDGWAPYIVQFAGVAVGWSLITWVWASVLLSYNNRPLSSHVLVRVSVHFWSFATLAIGWFGISIMLGTQFPLQCDFETPSDGLAYTWCAFGGTSFALSVLLWGLCTAAATIVYLAARATGAGLAASNVAHGDHKLEFGSRSPLA